MSNRIQLDSINLGSSTDKRERRDAAANRLLILETADSLFAERGVDAVNMADIAQAAGVGKGTLYRRFTNKAELCLALMDNQMRDFQEGILSQMRQMNDQEISKLEQLDQFLDSLVYFIDRHIPLLCVVEREGLLEELGDHDRQQPHFWQHMTVSGLLQAAVDQGELPPDLDTIYTADALLATLNASLFRYQREAREFSPTRISAGLRRLVKSLSDHQTYLTTII